MAASPSAALLGGSSLVDCTQLIHEDTFGFFGCFFQRQILIDTRAKADRDAEEVGFRKEKYMMGCDVGTHIDSPNHFISGGRCIHELSMDELTAPGVVIDVSAKVQADGGADYSVASVNRRRGFQPRARLLALPWPRPSSLLRLPGVS